MKPRLAIAALPLALAPVAYGATMKNPDIELHRVDDHTYKGDIYLDLLRGEDYYGMDVCHWNLIGADVTFQVNKLYFSPSLFHDDLVSQHPVIRFFADRSYQLSTTQRVDTGNARREDFKEDADRTFSIELKAREKTP